jgi:hypothetical protein
MNNDDKKAQRRVVIAIILIGVVVMLLGLFQMLPGSHDEVFKYLQERRQKSTPTHLTEPE